MGILAKDQDFPFGKKKRIAIIILFALAIVCLALEMVLSFFDVDRSPKHFGLIMSPLLLGVSFILIGLSLPRPSYRHFAQTGKFLVLSRGGPIETKCVQLVWLDVLFFVGVGLGFFYISYLFF